MKHRLLHLALLIAFVPFHAFSQGCSDAGFCTVTPGDTNQLGLSLGVSTSYEVGGRDLVYIIPQVEARYVINDKSSISIRVPYVTIEEGKFRGFGDIIMNYSRKILDRYAYDAHVMIGARIATGTANETFNSRQPLPMAYQTSLGTHDLIAVGSFRYHKWSTRIGAQVPVINTNENVFYTEGSPHSSFYYYPDAENPPSSVRFIRGPDVLAAIERSFQVGKLQLKTGILAIGRLFGDQYWDQYSGKYRYIKDTQGLTLNLTAEISYPIMNGLSFNLAGGAPVVTREVRSDGLTRKYVVRGGISYQF